jgi:hypothetical protein
MATGMFSDSMSSGNNCWKKPVPQLFERQIATGYDTKKDPNVTVN